MTVAFALFVAAALTATACSESPTALRGSYPYSQQSEYSYSSPTLWSDATLWYRRVWVCSVGVDGHVSIAAAGGAPTVRTVESGQCEQVHYNSIGTEEVVSVTWVDSISVPLDSIVADSTHGASRVRLPTIIGEMSRGVVTTTSKGGIVTFHADSSATSPVPAVAPDSVPDWVYADTNLIPASAQFAAEIAAQILVVAFNPAADSLTRASIADVNGLSVVGGYGGVAGSEGLYLMRAPSASSFAALDSVRATLDMHPSVALATFATVAGGDDYLLPRDGATMGSWELASSSAAGVNWALERIAAPQAWGCSTGSADVDVGVLDLSFPSTPDVIANVSSVDTLPRSGLDRHGLAVASILAARGDNGIGMAGVAWRASLRLVDRRRSGTYKRLLHSDVWNLFKLAIRSDVVNLSGAAGVYPESGPFIEDPARMRMREEGRRTMEWIADALSLIPNRGLIVLSAGNRGVDARWNVFPYLVEFDPSHTLVVAASTEADTLRTNSNRGSFVSVSAPGVNVAALTQDGAIAGFAQTSAAAPLVSGIATLLFAFDPDLTAAEVRDLVVAGAVVGGRQSNGVYVANAYESLKLAARREGAPLCGNRVWQLPDGTVRVERGQVAHTIISGIANPFEGNFVNVHHGGKRIELAFGNRYSWNPSSRTWVEQGWSADSARFYGADFKGSGAHFGDHQDSISTQVFGDRVAGGVQLRVHRASIRAGVPDPDAAEQMHVVPLSLDSATTTICVKERQQAEPPGAGAWTCEAEAVVGTWEHVNAIPPLGSMNMLHALAPSAMFAVIPVTATRETRSFGSAWGACTDADADNYPTVRCRHGGASQSEPSEQRIMRVDFSTLGGSWSELTIPSLAASPNPLRVFWLSINEAGTELILQAGANVTSVDATGEVRQCVGGAHRWVALSGHPTHSVGTVAGLVTIPGLSVCSGEVDGGAATAAIRAP